MGSGHDVAVITAGAAGNDPLLYHEFTVFNFIGKGVFQIFIAHAFVDGFFRFVKDVFQIGIEFVNREGIARMHGHGNHRLDGAEVDINEAVVIGHIGRIQFFIGISAAVLSEIGFRIFVGPPYGRQARRFRRHDVDAVAVIRRHGSDAGADEFHDLIFDVAVLKDGSDDGNSDVMRADGRIRFSRKVDADDAGVGNVIRIFQELFYQFTTAFSDSHRSQGTVAGMTVRTDDHLAAAGHFFTHILMDDSDVRGHKNTAVFFRCRKTEYMIVFINGAADGTE